MEDKNKKKKNERKRKRKRKAEEERGRGRARGKDDGLADGDYTIMFVLREAMAQCHSVGR